MKKEELVVEYCENEFSESTKVFYIEDIKKAIIYGFDAGAKSVLDSASDGFEEWCSSPDESDFERDIMKIAWQASKLSTLKELENDEDMLRTHMNSIGYRELAKARNGMLEMKEQLLTQRDNLFHYTNLQLKLEEALFEIANMRPHAGAAGDMKKLAKEALK